jgi:hypothetical protein
MSWEKHDDNCPGCRPAIINRKTMKAFADGSPVMMAVDKVWDATTPSEREAWHRVTCQNSRAPSDLELSTQIANRIQAALATLSD